MSAVVIKVGGSLFDLPDLGPRLRAFLAALPTPRVLLVAGGGAVADLVRAAQATDGLDDATCHWLALGGMRFMATLALARLDVPGAFVSDAAEWESAWRRGALPLLDAHAFAAADEGRAGRLPHTWDVTSDSIAARAAVVFGISRLVLLKSRDWDEAAGWDAAARAGVVDAAFAQVVGTWVEASVVNFRTWQPPLAAPEAPPAAPPPAPPAHGP
jgi:aspartokinase-like uncharacterized kinase